MDLDLPKNSWQTPWRDSLCKVLFVLNLIIIHNLTLLSFLSSFIHQIRQSFIHKSTLSTIVSCFIHESAIIQIPIFQTYLCFILQCTNHSWSHSFIHSFKLHSYLHLIVQWWRLREKVRWPSLLKFKHGDGWVSRIN